MAQKKISEGVAAVPVEELESRTALHHIEVVVLPEFDSSSQRMAALGKGKIIFDVPVAEVGMPQGAGVADSRITLDDPLGTPLRSTSLSRSSGMPKSRTTPVLGSEGPGM